MLQVRQSVRVIYKNKYGLFTLIAIALCIQLPYPGRAQDTISSRNSLRPDSLEDAFLLKAIHYTFLDSFRTALGSIDSLIIIHPDFIGAKAFKIGILYTRMNDDENYGEVDYFKALIDSTQTDLEEFLERHPDDVWALFFTGTAIGYEALYEGFHGSWLKALTKGLKAGKYYSRANVIDPTFYEDYVGLGSLNYWRSSRMGFLRSLPFIPDKREEGIAQMKLAIDSSRYSSMPAATGLAWIYINRREYSAALKILNKLVQDGYGGRQILWPMGIAQFRQGRSSRTIEIFTDIRASLERQGNQNGYNLGLCDYFIGVANFWRGDFFESLKNFNSLLDRPVRKDVADRLKENYDRAEKYKDRIKKIIAQRNQTGR